MVGMAYHTDSYESGGEDREDYDDLMLSLPRLTYNGDYPKQYGPIEVIRDFDSLSLRRENQGGLGWESYLFFAIAMLSITILGILSVVENNQNIRINDPNPVQVSIASHNQFAILWLFAVVLMMVGIPLYVKKAYRAALVFKFDHNSGWLYENKKRITPLRRIEYIAIREAKDTDGRYLYLLQVIHTDGYELLLHNGYDEREVLNLAKEICSFTGYRTKYTGSR